MIFLKIIFASILITRTRFFELKFSILVKELLPDCIRKLNKFNLTNSIIDLALKFVL